MVQTAKSQHFFERLFNALESLQNDSCVICGDFKLVISPNSDNFSYKTINNKKARQYFLAIDIIGEKQLFDTFRELFSDVKSFTWRRSNPLQQSRQDFILATSDFLTHVDNLY